MSVFNRYNGKRITSSHPAYAKARWWMYKRVNGKVFHHAIAFALPADFPFLKHVVEHAIRQHKMSYYTVSDKSILLGQE